MLELAARSDWKLAAILAAGCLVAEMVLIPALFGRSPITAPLAAIFALPARLLALVFAAIAVVRFLKQWAARTPSTRGSAYESGASASRQTPAGPQAALSETKKTWLRSASSPAQPAPSRPTAWSLDVLDRVEWKRFEDLCCAFYREKGIRAETTRLGADGGVDIRLFQDDADPARATAVVQCKAHNKPIGVKPVRELRGVMAHEKVDKAFFMAPNGFTEEARAFAAENRITLVDGKLFLAMLEHLPAESSQRLLDLATEGDWTTPTCPQCGGRMTGKEGKHGQFWACVTRPRCRGTLPMRAVASQGAE